MAAVKGHCEPAFQHLKDILAKNVASEEELGASICVSIDGRTVVDIWAGYVDEARSKEWEENTIVNVWSSSKTISNMAVLIAADRGLLNVNDKVAKHWPEFAQNGKEDVEVRHILSHNSGLSGWAKPMTIEEVCDVDFSTAELAKQAPLWKPGSRSGYHAVTQGHLDGELIRRVTGKRLKQFITEEMAGPLGADFQLGAQEKDWPRISTLIPPPPFAGDISQIDPESTLAKTLFNPPLNATWPLTPMWRKSEQGATNGHGNARSLNRIASIITLGGEVDGIRLLSQKTIDLIFQEQSNGVDRVLGHPIRFGIGYGLPLKEKWPEIPEGKVCFWGGWVSNRALLCGQVR